MNPAFPTTFNDTTLLINYAKNVGIIFGGFGIVAVLLSAVMICVFVKFCCTRPKESQEFKKMIHFGFAIGVAVLALIGCAVGWGYNKQCGDGVTKMTGSVSNLLNSSGNLIIELEGTISSVSVNLDARVSQMSNIQFGDLMTPINSILGLIDNMQSQTNELYFMTVEASDNVTIIKSELAFVNEEKNDVGLDEVPSPNDIPNIDSSFVDSIRSGNNSINNMRQTTLDVKKNVNESLTEINQDLLGALNEQASNYHSNVNEISASFRDVNRQITDLDEQYSDTYEAQINKYSSQRTAVVNGILILPIAVSILAGLGVFLRMPKLLSITCALSFICFFWYILIAGVNYTLYVVTDGFCAQQAVIVDSVLNSLDAPFNVPGSNASFKTGDKVGELIHCSGETTIISVFEAGFLITDLQTQIREQATNISRRANEMNFASDFVNATNSLNAYENSTTTPDFSQNKNLQEVLMKLDNNTQTLNNSITDIEHRRDASLADVNYITLNTEKNDGTPVPPQYYSAANISLLDCNDATWDDTRNHTVLCLSANITVTLNGLITASINVYNNVTDIEERVTGLSQSVDRANNLQSEIVDDVTVVKVTLNTSYAMTNQFITQITDGVSGILNVVSDGVGELASDTKCAFIGKFYIDFSDGFCKTLSPSLRVIGAMMVLGGGSLFGAAVLSAVTIYKIKASGTTGDDDDA